MRFVIAVLTAGLLVACAGDAEPPASDVPAGPTLTIEGRAFGQPPQLAAGETMVIDNQDAVRHTFTSSDGVWDEVEVAGNSSAEFTVPADLGPGDYRFICVVHSDMGGTLTVTG